MLLSVWPRYHFPPHSTCHTPNLYTPETFGDVHRKPCLVHGQLCSCCCTRMEPAPRICVCWVCFPGDVQGQRSLNSYPCHPLLAPWVTCRSTHVDGALGSLPAKQVVTAIQLAFHRQKKGAHVPPCRIQHTGQRGSFCSALFPILTGIE